ncbi:MAG: ATP-dependent DNA helicase RecG [Bacteroidia bacterium]|nr:ATP-dependent DNA helicase RecG [Bacteroidia bacterium]MDW8057493.1 ATP-dependent DNA helicase RecG [Bacteroidia bacterium]
MKASSTDIWQTPLVYLKGVGPRRAEVLRTELGLETYESLIEYFPRRYLDYAQITPIAQARSEQEAVFRGKLGPFQVRPVAGGKRAILVSTLYDGQAWMELVWYQNWEWVRQKFTAGQEVIAIGRPVYKKRTLQLAHPELIPLSAGKAPEQFLKVYPVYPLTEKLRQVGLDNKRFHMLFEELYRLTGFEREDPIPESVREKYDLLPLSQALRALHLPTSVEEAEKARYRFKFQEFFLLQVLLIRRKYFLKTQYSAPAFTQVGPLLTEFYEKHLPFPLTEAQKRVIKEIRRDLGLPTPMNRLIQGDVGSGKTIVALFAALIVIGNGYQVALMAPTEVLAEQHARSFRKWLSPLGIGVGLLLGSTPPAQKKRILDKLASGELACVIGTHALFQKNVQYHRLGLTIIDEQHKFGVRQRAALWEKAHPYRPHNLLLTATPIPRTLALSVYGDVDVSIIDELPPGRQPVKTLVRTEAHRREVWNLLRSELEKGRQAYIIYPLVEESEKSDLKAVEEGYEQIRSTFPNYTVGMVHGRMSSERKEREMYLFKSGHTQILVGTTVVEVGVDVPNATVLIVEHADRFGLSQLHQLRGRVGRGQYPSYAIFMVPNGNLSEAAITRLQALVQYNDGFRIAEIDLKLRGPGDFLGTKQSGLPEFKIADIVEDQAILRQARQAAEELVAQDPSLALYPTLRSYLTAYAEKHSLELFTA